MVVHLQGWALKVGQLTAFHSWFSQIAEQTSYLLGGNAWNGDSLNGLRHSHQLLAFSIILLKHLPERMVLLRGLPFLGDRRIVVVGGDMRHVGVKRIEAVGACGCCEVGASEAHVQTHRAVVIDKVFDMFAEILRGPA